MHQHNDTVYEREKASTHKSVKSHAAKVSAIRLSLFPITVKNSTHGKTGSLSVMCGYCSAAAAVAAAGK